MNRLAGLLLVGIILALLVNRQAAEWPPLHAAAQAVTPTATPFPGVPGKTPVDQSYQTAESDAEAVSLAVAEAVSLAQVDGLAFLIYDTRVENVQLSPQSDWATALLVPALDETGEVLPSEPGLALARLRRTGWSVTLPHQPDWLETMLSAPDTLLNEDQKAYWLELYQTAETETPSSALGGYLLPWEGGRTRSLSQSINHDNYTASGSAHYAFDFYTSGVMWNIRASRAGTVWKWKDDVETCLQYTCSSSQAVGNYLVLRDPTTSPVSYQLYLHLAKGSIPADLKEVGKPLLAGQFLGIADNTGQSWGHHLHFQVHTNAASYWGRSVDITFDDVPINGGRPRTCSEASNTTDPYNQCSSSYTSQNYDHSDAIPPQGDMLEPLLHGFDVTSGTLNLAAWASDQGSGVAGVQFLAYFNEAWREIGPSFAGPLPSYQWNLCNSGVPVGPLSIAMRVTDFGNNVTPLLTGLRHGVNNSDCASPPPSCSPSSSQAALFSLPDFQGECAVLGIGDYSDSGALGMLGDNRAASIKLGAGVRATLFSAPGFAGRSDTFNASDAHLSDDVIGSGTTTSLRVAALSALPGTPLPAWPGNGAAMQTNDSLTFAWLDSGFGDTFEVQVLRGETVVASGSPSEAYWNISGLLSGSYTWRVRARNSAGTSDWSDARLLTIQSVVTSPHSRLNVPLDTNLEMLSAGWEKTGGWRWVDDAQQARSPSHLWAFSSNGGGQVSYGSLTSPEISLPNTGYALSFYYRYQSSDLSPHADLRFVQVSRNGGAFTTLLRLTDDPADIWLRSPEINLDSYAGGVIRLRFIYHSVDGLANSPLGWEIDDLQIAPQQVVDCSPGEPDNSPSSARSLAFGSALGGRLCPGGDIDYYKIQVTSAGTRLIVDVDTSDPLDAYDPYLFLLDADGRSVLADNDDEVPFQLTDSLLNYRFTRPGTYYLKLRAWNHPEGGGMDFAYSIRASTSSDRTSPSLGALVPAANAVIGKGITRLSVTAADTGSGMRSVSFYWHDRLWSGSSWVLLGTDWDGRDGWSMDFSPDPAWYADRRGLAFAAVASDLASNYSTIASYQITVDAGLETYLPTLHR